MKFIVRFFALVLASLVFSLTSNFIFNKTLLHADFIIPRVKEAKVFQAASEIMPTLIQRGEGNPQENKLIADKVKTLFTPEYIETKLTTFMKQAENHYRHDGAAPTLDLSAIAQEAQAMGLPIDASQVTTPLTIPEGTDAQITTVVEASQQAQQIALMSALVLILLISLISIKLHDYSGLINVLVINTVLCLLFWASLRFAPTPLTQFVPQSTPELKPLTDAGTQALIAITRDIATHFGIFAAVYGGLGAAVYALAFISKTRHKKEAL